MKLHLDRFEGANAFSGYGEDHVLVNGRRHDASLVVLPGELLPWAPRRADELEPGHFAPLAQLAVEIVLVGTGARHALVHPRVWAPLAAARMGVEVMDTRAACRTYNILLAEGRRVAAALILPGEPAAG